MIGACGVLAILAALGARTPPTSVDRFESLVREIGALRVELSGMERGEMGLLREMGRLEVEAALRSRERARLEMLQSSAGKDLNRTREDLRVAGRTLDRERRHLARHLREAYKMGRHHEMRMILSLTEPVNMMRAMAYFDVMTRRQAGVVSSLHRRRAEMEALERSLDMQTASLAGLHAQETAKLAELETVRARQAALLESTRTDLETHRGAIAELTRAAEQLEAAIVSSTARGAGDAAAAVAAPVIDPARLRGALEWPVAGDIAVPYGDIRHPRFRTVTPHPGLDIRTAPGAPIRAVLGGRVVLARRLSGYGNTVLLDHGGHYVSVTARASLLGVAEGDDVLSGQIIGQSAEQGPDGGPPLVYFELRRDGVALDPAGWLKKKGMTSRKGADR